MKYFMRVNKNSSISFEKGYNPKFPILSRTRAHILVEHLFHFASSLSRNRSTRCRKHRLTVTVTIHLVYVLVRNHPNVRIKNFVSYGTPVT